MFSRIDAKASAKASLKGHWGQVIFTYFIVLVIVFLTLGLSEAIPRFVLVATSDTSVLYCVSLLVCDFIYYIIAYTVSIGSIKYFLAFARHQEPTLTTLFWGFKRPFKIFGLYFMIGLFTFLWSLLLLIPGIIKSFSYMLAPYILVDNPDMKVCDAITESRRMMHGNKLDYFVTSLSFIGWFLLTFLTFGIGIFWLGPYIILTFVYIYLQLSTPPTDL